MSGATPDVSQPRPPTLLVVIGSYAWRSPATVQDTLTRWWNEHGQPPVRLVTSGCPAGAERDARVLGEGLGWETAVARDEDLPQLTGAAVFAFIRDASFQAERALDWVQGGSVWHRVIRDETRNDSPWADR